MKLVGLEQEAVEGLEVAVVAEEVGAAGGAVEEVGNQATLGA